MPKSLAAKKEALYVSSDPFEEVTCHLCPYECTVAPSGIGLCGIRSNRNGVLYADFYGKTTRQDVVDGSELPLYHYKPGSKWLRIGMKGCNMRCPFCNTAAYSQTGGARAKYMNPAQAVDLALESGASGIAFGVSEPAISHEYVYDVLNEAKAAGLARSVATSGFWSTKPFWDMLGILNAVTFGFKGYDEQFLHRTCGGQLSVIKSNVALAKEQGVHVETTYLVIERDPDWLDQAEEFSQWLASVDRNIPCILLRMEPAYIWENESGTPDAISQVRELMTAHLNFVYEAGN